MSAREAVLAVALSVVGGGGCSLLFVNGPPPARERERHQSISCTDSNVWPVVDVLWAAFQVGRTAFAASRDDSYYEDSMLTRESDIALGVAFLGLHAVSSVVGFRSVSACKEALGDGGARPGVYRGRVMAPTDRPGDRSRARAEPDGVAPATVDDEDPDQPPPAKQATPPGPPTQAPSAPTWQAPGTPGRGG